MNIFIGKDGKQLGPFSEDQLRSMFESGMLTAGDLAWQEGWPNWTPLWQVFGMPPPLVSNPAAAASVPANTGEKPWRWIGSGWAAVVLSMMPGKVGIIALVHLVISLIVLFCSKSPKARCHAKLILCVSAVLIFLGVLVGFLEAASGS